LKQGQIATIGATVEDALQTRIARKESRV